MGAKIGEYREVPGPKGRELLLRGENSLAKTTVSSGITVLTADRLKITDQDGNEYLCFSSGVGVSNLGYYSSFQKRILKVIDRLRKNKIPFLHIGTDWINPFAIEAAEKLLKVTPIRGGKARVFFTTSGTDATEAAVKSIRAARLAKSKKYPPEEAIFVRFSGAFHGRTHGSMTLLDRRKSERVEAFGTPYRSFELPFPSKNRYDEFLAGLKELSRPDILEKVEGIFIELVQGEGGINIADKEMVKILDHFCRVHDIPLIVDEIQAGFCRTGSFWSYEQYDVKPDVVLFAKAAGGGLFAVGGAIIREDLSFKILGQHSSTFGPDPIPCAVLSAVITEMEKKGFARKAKEMGVYLKERLCSSKLAASPLVKDVRGLGLMAGIEFVNPETRDKVLRIAERYGLKTIAAGSSVIRLMPPLIVRKKEINKAIEILEKAAAQIS